MRYDEYQGILTFRVKHFTNYAIKMDDESEKGEEEESEESEDQQQVAKLASQPKSHEKERFSFGHPDKKFGSKTLFQVAAKILLYPNCMKFTIY